MEDAIIDNPNQSVLDLFMSPAAISSIQQACKWALTLACFAIAVTIIATGLIVYNGDLLGRELNMAYLETSSPVAYIVLIIVLIIALAYTVSAALLISFSTKTKKALAEHDIQKLERGISSLKIFFILSAIGGMFYAVSVIAEVILVIKS